MSTTWICVGTTIELPDNRSRMCRTAFGEPVIIQRHDNEIQAYSNTCSHRHTQLMDVDAKGCGTIKCPYHGWQFGRDGEAVCVPERKMFASTPGLYRYQVTVAGTLIFVSHPGNTVSLIDSVGEKTIKILADVSSHFGELVDEFSLTINASPVVCIENALESYHVPYVHPDSIARIGMGNSEEWRDGDSSGFATEVGSKVANAAIEAQVPVLALRTKRLDGYMHIFAWPNFMLATTHCLTFSLQFYEPHGLTRTKFRSQVYSARLSFAADAAEQAAIDALHRSVVAMNRQTFSEDAKICERVKLDVGSCSGPAVYGEHESRVRWFREAFIK